MSIISNGPRKVLRSAAVVVLGLSAVCFEAGASQASEDFKDGTRYEKQGQFFRAAEAYSRVLRLLPGDQKARSALTRVADRAIDEKLRAAEALEVELKLDQAIVELDTAARLHQRLATLKIEPGKSSVIEERKHQLVSRRIEALQAEAAAAQAAGLWSAAVAHLQEVEARRPDFEDTRARLRGVWMSWGDTALRDGRIRAAVERYEQASQVPGLDTNEAAGKAAAIRIGLGTSALVRGACRGAVADLRRAELIAPGSVAPDLLRQAESCATTCLQLTLRADPDAGLADAQLDPLTADVRKRIGEGASEFLRLRSSRPTDTKACGGRTVPGFNGQPMNVGPYSGLVRVTAVNLIRQPASSLTRQTVSQHGAGVDTLVSYEQYDEDLTGTISGWVTVTDQRVGGMSVPLPVRVTAQATARWQRSPVSSVTRQDPFTRQTTTAVMVNASGGKARAEEERRRARGVLLEKLLEGFAEETARLLLATVDVEPAVPDPSELPEVVSQ